MADFNKIGEGIVEVDGVKGVYALLYTIKKDAEPLSDTKIVYDDDDWEWREEFRPLSESELAALGYVDETATLPDRLSQVETTTDDIVLCLADSIGGANAN